MSGLIRFEQRDSVAFMTIARPQCRNALSRALLAAINQCLEQAHLDGACAVVLAADGGFFSAGADLGELTGTPADASFDDAVARTVIAVRASPLPVIAAIEGGCIGAALDLALACDLRVVARSAFLELPAIRMGLLYNPEALQRIAQRLPSATLARLLLAGERISGADAMPCGIATHLAEGDPLPSAVEIAGRFRGLHAEAVAATKGFLAACATPDLDIQAWHERRLALLGSAERHAAVQRARNPSKN